MSVIATDVGRPTEAAAIGTRPRPLPAREVLHTGFCSALAVKDRYGLRLFANALIRQTRGASS